uniref:Uncharacterized protein n=1 Tax=Phaseolus vulgaris TaxID=3885 RepID=V7AHM2_PHAVU|nr:hypothetical protein PHAVU_011G121100g [Phaseolus vulgaris]ESW04735.1 hypothetical protein PHAVU_011G121100g [Phaseolus vulgaris]
MTLLPPARQQARHDGPFPANGWKPYPLRDAHKSSNKPPNDLRGTNLPRSHRATVPTRLIRASSPARPPWRIARMLVREKPRG